MHEEQYNHQHKQTIPEKSTKHRFNEVRPCCLRPRGKKEGGFLLISTNQYTYSNEDQESSASAILSSTIAHKPLYKISLQIQTLEIKHSL